LSIQAHWYYIKGDYLHFIGLHYQERLGRVHAIGLLVAFIILIIWFLFFYKLDLFEPEKKYWLILVVLTSALLTNLSLIAYEFFEVNLNFYLNGKPFNDLLFSIFGIGLIEETVKLIPFMFILLLKPKLINEPYDILLYMVMSALAFAFTENLIYFTEGSLHTYTARAIYSSMGHMFFSATIAYGFILANYRYNNWKFVPTILLFFFISITAHGVFDYLLFYDYYVVFVFFFIILTKAFIKYINNSLNNSVFFDYHIKMKSINLRQLLAIGISLIFAVEFIYTASYYSIAKALDEAFSLNNYSSLFVLIFIADHFSHFNLVKGEWGVFNLSFNTYNLHTAEENFVGIKARINIPEKLENINRIEYHSTIEGELINKVQIYYDSIWLKKKKIVEKGWFIMALDESILINGKIVNKLAINFVSNSANLYYRSEDVYWMQIKDESQLADNNIKSNFILLGKAKLDKIES
ncbi:MAG: PrsW family intramembrane metalloprotease, partial [Bacteroidales bacterium]|nr:PrsW family intramembrane metalloprotease [Bacteroidales bacterium]